jgi:hypothetical protein
MAFIHTVSVAQAGVTLIAMIVRAADYRNAPDGVSTKWNEERGFVKSEAKFKSMPTDP